MQDLIEKFSLEKLNPSPAAINFSKLDHFNKLHIKALSNRELAEKVKPYFEARGIHANLEMLSELSPVINERLVTLDDAVDFCAFIFLDEIEISKESLSIKDMSVSEVYKVADDAYQILEGAESWDVDSLEVTLKGYMEKQGLTPQGFYGFLREAISGQRVTPPLFESMAVLGREKTLERLLSAKALFA
jgi:glutamyl-tRNA synthetase